LRAECSVTPASAASRRNDSQAVWLGRTAAQEILTSTAAVVAHEWSGRIYVTPDVAAEAIARFRRYIAGRGFGGLVRVYAVVTFAENHGAVRHYPAGISEEDFVHGTLHRPWVRYDLDDELLAGLANGLYALEVRDDRRWVVQTAAGEEHYGEVRDILAAAGYLERRLQLIYLSQFNLFQDWDANVARMVPNALEQRREFTAFAGLAAGARVLEAGCGMATQTFEGGLWEAVGPSGSIVGIDPAPGMLKRAAAKARRLRAKNVTFVRARAERLPMFEDGEFDATVGTAFLHFADAPRAVRELCRVTRPGGAVTIAAGCRFPLDMPWFREWFAPIFDLARRHGREVVLHLHERGEVPRLFAEAGLQDVQVETRWPAWILLEPDVSVSFLVQGISFFQRELELLPWQARLDLIEELKRIGAKVCRETTAEERTLRTPVELVKGAVPPA